jgi:hypothetical protein
MWVCWLPPTLPSGLDFVLQPHNLDLRQHCRTTLCFQLHVSVCDGMHAHICCILCTDLAGAAVMGVGFVSRQVHFTWPAFQALCLSGSGLHVGRP